MQSTVPAAKAPHAPRDAGATRATFGLAVMVVLWGVNFSLIKIGLLELTPAAFNALRFPLASATLFVLLRLQGPISLPRGHDRWRVLALGIIGNTIYQLLFITGMEYAHAGIASLLLSGTPVMTALLSAALGHERVGRAVWLAVVATFGGIVLVVLGGPAATAGGTPMWANALMLGASASWAVYTVGSHRLVERYGPMAFTAWTLWWGTLGVVAAGLPSLLRIDPAAISLRTWAAVTYSGVFSLGVAYSLWYYGVQHVGSTRTAVFNNLVPVVALAVAWIWLSDAPTPLQLAGAVVIIAGVSISRRRRQST